jgi:hypothetical protein
VTADLSALLAAAKPITGYVGIEEEIEHEDAVERLTALAPVLAQACLDAEKALEDLARYGTRHDCNPTRQIHADNPEWMRSDGWWVARANSMDNSVRERAAAALASLRAATRKSE